MPRHIRAVMAALTATLTLAGAALASSAPSANAENNGVGLKPALGWSSWSFLRSHPTASAIDAQADAMKSSGLAKEGYQYVNLDDFYYECPGSQGPNVDQYGRWVTDPAKFPSSGSENGIKAVADHVHADGLKFGLYVTPGISKQAVAQNTPIQGTSYHADDIAEPSVSEKNYNCGGMVGIDYSKPGAQAFINSWADEMTSWGVDYVKIDGVGSWDIPDVEAWSNALRQTGRPIHLELSNSLSVSNASTWEQYANGWRTGGDIECYCGSGGSSYPLTDWNNVAGRFNQVAAWQPYGGPGAFNDYDSTEVGNGSNDGLTPVERQTQMSLWAMAASPLILGTDLTSLDPTDLDYLKNTDVLAVDQDGIDASRIVNGSTEQVFVKKESNGDAIVALFNTGSSTETISTTASAAGLSSAPSYLLNDLWSHKTTETAGTISATIPSHGVALYRATPASNPAAAPPSTTLSLSGLSEVASGQTVTATESFTDNGREPAQGVRLALRLPAGWSATPSTPTTFAAVPTGRTVQATFQVKAPTAAQLFETGTATDGVTYTWPAGTQQSWNGSQSVTVSSPVQAPYRTVASTTADFGQVGTELGVRASGADVFGSTNEYGAIYQQGAEQNGTVATVEITSQSDTNAWAKAGIMVRNDITAANTSPGYLIVAVTPGHGYVVQWDSTGNGQLDSNSAPSNEGLGTASYPTWLKLVRNGTSYSGYYSTDDKTWTLIDTVSVPSAATTQDVGLFSTAHNSGTIGETDFDHFTLSQS
ncbi:NEW3 domain-containing protein [Streptomyces sp. RB6PN25]|uniref:Alpha-galactosidase n=1 Tax=Streptomyces humicola TaxID=2953240 RepID=A0ABT1PRT2_9ACTN|nr:NEW3 domain-containing protein [Streptomyces humicola]MCQ4080382.1 NEW3 domain-containing protein [Streptomyces humicola]